MTDLEKEINEEITKNMERKLWKIANLRLLWDHLQDWENFAYKFEEYGIARMLHDVEEEIVCVVEDLEKEE